MIFRTAKRSIRADVVDPQEYQRYQLRVACEDCSHYNPEAEPDSPGGGCTIGYNARNHRRANQLRTYALGGRVGFCRFLELD